VHGSLFTLLFPSNYFKFILVIYSINTGHIVNIKIVHVLKDRKVCIYRVLIEMEIALTVWTCRLDNVTIFLLLVYTRVKCEIIVSIITHNTKHQFGQKVNSKTIRASEW